MAQLLGVFLFGIVSLSAIDIPLDDHLKTFSLNGIQVWLKEYMTSPAQVACRFIGQDRFQGKPIIFDLDCPTGVFVDELPNFLDYCEEEIQKNGGASIGLVAVGSMDPQELHQYLSNRYEQSEIRNETSEEAIQLIPRQESKEIDVLISYPAILTPVQSDADLKKLWVFFLIQSMAENRFKKATVEVDGKWIAPEDSKYLLPSLITMGHGVERSPAEDRLLKSFLKAIQILKERGFTESELADSKSQLLKHLKRFYETNPTEKTLADFYASHLAASLPCSDYALFMKTSLEVISEVDIADIAEMLKVSFRDDTRQVVIHHPESASISIDQVQSTLNQFVSDSLEFNFDDDKVVLIEGKDPFSQLLITEGEEKMMLGTIHTVAESSLIKLGILYFDLNKKRLQLLHIHPLRSLATMFADAYAIKCVAKIMKERQKRSPFIENLAIKFNKEAERGNLMTYVQGFSLAVKANPDQVRIFLTNKEWEKLVKYLLMLNN